MLICLLSLIMGACKDDKNVFVEVPSEFLNLDFDARQDRRTIKIDSDGEWRLISSDPHGVQPRMRSVRTSSMSTYM